LAGGPWAQWRTPQKKALQLSSARSRDGGPQTALRPRSLERFAAEPNVYQSVIEKRLVEKFETEPEMQAEFVTMMEQVGPQVDVFQEIAKANGITGSRVAKMLSGNVNVKQKIKHGKNVKGVGIKQMG
jgi:hypothetical protein